MHACQHARVHVNFLCLIFGNRFNVSLFLFSQVGCFGRVAGPCVNDRIKFSEPYVCKWEPSNHKGIKIVT